MSKLNLRHNGLPEGYSHFDLKRDLNLAKDELCLKNYHYRFLANLIDLTSPQDYTEGSICAVFYSVNKLADMTTCSPRTINSYERALHWEWIILSSSARRRRGGQRKNGKIVWAAGINLKPLIDRVHEVRNCAEIAESRKLEIKFLRGEILELQGQLRQHGFDDEARRILPRARPSEVKDSDNLKKVLSEFRSAVSEKISLTAEQNLPDRTVINQRPYTISNQEEYSCTDFTALSNANFRNFSLLDFQQYASRNFSFYWQKFEASEGIERGFERAAQATFAEWGGSNSTWWNFVNKHGLMLASLCVFVTDKNAQSDANPSYFVKNPIGCFIGQGIAIENGALNLQGLIGQIIHYEKNRHVS